VSAARGGLFLFIVVLCSMFGQFATELYLPSMPAMARYFNVNISVVQLSITNYTFGYAVGSFWCGYISDKSGRLKVLFPCIIVTIFGSLMCCFAFDAEFLFVGRFIQGLGLGGIGVVSRSVVRDISKTKMEFAKFASILGSVSAIAIAFAPIIGGYIEKYLFWRINFVLLFLIALCLAWLCRYKLVETNEDTGKIDLLEMIHDYFEVFKNKQFLLYNCISSLTLAGFISYQTISAYLLQVKVGLAPDSFGYTSLLVTIALILGGVINSKVVERRGVEVMLKFGSMLYLLAGALYVVGGLFNIVNVVSILLPMMLFTFGAGIIYPNASSGALSLFTKKAGTAASIYNCFQMLGGTMGSWIISSIYANTPLPLGVMFVFIGLSGMLVYYSLQFSLLHNESL